MKLLKKILYLSILLFLLFATSCAGYYFAATKSVRLDAQKLMLNEKNIVVYDKNGEPVKNVSSLVFGQTAPINEIPQHTKNAFIHIEDKRFYTHSGFDVRRIARALFNNLKARSFKEGASTISQQLIKNTHLSQEKTVKRKLQEWKLTRQLEKWYSKDEILEKYLNSIYFGHSCFGIRAAADFYFGKSVSELTISDSAILAGLVRSPNNYSPFKNPENCAKRKKTVLNVLYQNGVITQNEKNDALQAPLPIFNEQTLQNASFLHFVFDELSAIAEENDLTVGGKIEIYTGLDRELQKALEELPDTNSDKTAFVIDKQTNLYKAYISSVGAIRRLPGSLIKPLLVYAPAIEENILSPATPILDEAVNYGGYRPQNYDGIFHGYVSARNCIAKSLNVPAVKVLQSLGVEKGAKYMEKLGLPIEKEDFSLALALGGMRNGFTLQDIAQAYSALETGEWQTCAFISALKMDGKTVFERSNTKNRVFSVETAYLITDMLKTTAKEGTAKKLRALPFEIAAKTGTVGTEKGNTDAYALSYTTRDLAAVWLGNVDNTKINDTGGGLPCNLLLHINEYLYHAYKNKSENISNFQKPIGVQTVALDKLAYYDTHNILLADDLSPAEYRLNELFKTASIPTKKSDFFSNPSILPPTLTLENNKVLITFDKHTPTLYSYKIVRYDYATHNTIYEGECPFFFEDDTLKKNKKYLYTVIPIYNGIEGAPVLLPGVNTSPIHDDKILNEEWWAY